jgi:hypothetical protein
MFVTARDGYARIDRGDLIPATRATNKFATIRAA